MQEYTDIVAGYMDVKSLFQNCKLRESKGHIQEALELGLLEYEDLDLSFMVK